MKWLKSRPRFAIQAFRDQLQLFQAFFNHFGKFEYSFKEKRMEEVWRRRKVRDLRGELGFLKAADAYCRGVRLTVEAPPLRLEAQF